MGKYYDTEIVLKEGVRFSAPYGEYPENIPEGQSLIAVLDCGVMRCSADVPNKRVFEGLIAAQGNRMSLEFDADLPRGGGWLGYSLYLVPTEAAKSIPNGPYRSSALKSLPSIKGFAVNDENLAREIPRFGHDGWMPSDYSHNYRFPLLKPGEIAVGTCIGRGREVLHLRDTKDLKEFTERYDTGQIIEARIFAVHGSLFRPDIQPINIGREQERKQGLQP